MTEPLIQALDKIEFHSQKAYLCIKILQNISYRNMNLIDMFRRDSTWDHCPDIEELVAFVLEIRESIFIKNHLRQCEICEDLAGGIETFKKERKNITPEEIHRQLIDRDEAYLNVLKLHKNPDDMIGKLSRKLDLPETIERRIRKALEYPLDDSFSPDEDD